MLCASAASCSAVKATKREAPLVAEVLFKWTAPFGNLCPSLGGRSLGSKGQTTWPKRHATNTSITKVAEALWGKARVPGLAEALSTAAASCLKVQHWPVPQ